MSKHIYNNTLHNETNICLRKNILTKIILHIILVYNTDINAFKYYYKFIKKFIYISEIR